MEAKKLKILYIIRTLHYGGGAERLLVDIYQELKKRSNVEVKIVVIEKAEVYKKYNIPNADYFEKLLADDKNVLYTSSKVNLRVVGKNNIDITEYKNIVDEFKPNIIHSHMYLAELLSREYLYKDAAYFTHVHDNIIQFNNLNFKALLNKNKLTNYYEKLRILRKYRSVKNTFISISKDAYNFIEKNIRPKKGDNILFYNAINYYAFHNEKQRELSTSKKIKLVSVGSLVKKKNQTFFVDLAIELQKRGILFEIDILGEGFERENIEKRIIENNLQKIVHLRSNVSNVKEYLLAADVFVHAATYEPFGLVILEAMAAGLPVICLNGKGNIDLNVEGKTGFMIDPPSAKSFADKIIFLQQHPSEYKAISGYCTTFAKQYDIDNYVSKLLSIYHSKLNNK